MHRSNGNCFVTVRSSKPKSTRLPLTEEILQVFLSYSAERRLCGFSFRKVGEKKIHEKYMMVFLYAERTPNEPRTNTERTRNDPRTTPERPPKKKN